MLRILGIMLLALCPVVVGNRFSTSLHKRTTELSLAVELVERMKTEIRFSAKEMKLLVAELAKAPYFQPLSFLGVCTEQLEQKTPFPAAWQTGLTAQPGHLSRDDLEQLSSLGHLLGSTDVEGQMGSLELVKQNLLNNLRRAKELYASKGKLYRSLGVLSGIALVVLMI